MPPLPVHPLDPAQVVRTVGVPAPHRNSYIAFIQRISGDHPEWGEDKIAEELAAKFGVNHSPTTIRRYMVRRQGPPRRTQTWRTFIQNHAKEVWACDILTQYTALFSVVYVFVVMEIGSRRIVHVNVTANPRTNLSPVSPIVHLKPT